MEATARSGNSAAVSAGSDVRGSRHGHVAGGGGSGSGGFGDVVVRVHRPRVAGGCRQVLRRGDVGKCGCARKGAERKRERQRGECFAHVSFSFLSPLPIYSASGPTSRRRARTTGPASSARRRRRSARAWFSAAVQRCVRDGGARARK